MKLYKASESKFWWFVWSLGLILILAVSMVSLFKVFGRDISIGIGVYPAVAVFLVLSVIGSVVIVRLLPPIDLRKKKE